MRIALVLAALFAASLLPSSRAEGREPARAAIPQSEAGRDVTSRYYWEHGTGPGSLRFWLEGSEPGSREYWEYGTGPGSEHYWRYGNKLGSEHHWRYATAFGSEYYWTYETEPGSRHYWTYGTGPGSEHHWSYGEGPSLGRLFVALCASGTLEIEMCAPLRHDTPEAPARRGVPRTRRPSR